MADPKEYTLFSGGANGAETAFGKLAEQYGVNEINFSFEGHPHERERGVRVLTPEELGLKDVSLAYVSKLLARRFSDAPMMRKVLQTIMYQVDSGLEVFVVGSVQDDNTVKGGTGWGAEFAKLCNKPLYVFDQAKDDWFTWTGEVWAQVDSPVIRQKHFTGTGSRFLEDNGKKALAVLFARSFG